MTVRTRIAPSPTGDPHVGTAYVALFNYVFAKQQGGQFLLRIEDTDQTRYRRGSEQAIMDSLRWLGLDWDEGPDKGGPHGPYRQSERKDIYRKYAEELVEKGEAYRCFCTPERLAELRAYQKAAGMPMGYDRRCRNIPPEESKQRAESGEPYVIRIKMPLEGEAVFHDRLRGKITMPWKELDDQILLKSDGFPTYHLANVVDDHLMKITHVIRAEEWISSTPKHVRLYEAFGWEPPEFIHLPLLRNPDKNKSKISKRKNPVSLIYYKETGILPEALRNFLALMGFSMGDDQEKFTLEEMIENFSWDKVSLGSPVFDFQKLLWLNGLYIRELETEEVFRRIKELWLNDEYLLRILPYVHERMKTLGEFADLTTFFLSGELDYRYEGEAMLPKKRTPAETAKMLTTVAEIIDSIDPTEYTREKLESELRKLSEDSGWKTRELFMTIRVAVTGRKASPPLFESMELIGRERTRARLRRAAEFVKTIRR